MLELAPTAAAVRDALARWGIAHVGGPIAAARFYGLAAALGAIVAEESIALRPGAHAYVAKPGRVPLHTDHPEVAVVAWWCEAQDALDGASCLLDTRPVVAALDARARDTLRHVDLACPPLAGGPPTLRFPVLRGADAVFCSPWLRSADPVPLLDRALDGFRARLAAAETRSIRLAPGDALFVDNRRVLHGRGAIDARSGRRLRRVWMG